MAIIRYTKNAAIKYAYLNIFPDQFKTEKEKADESWIKNTMDYFTNKAYAEYTKNRESLVRNYDLMKGILTPGDFYQDDYDEIRSFAEMLEKGMDLPSYVKHYSIVTTPINELIGEITKRPDTYRVKAFDDDSQSEELKFKTELLQEYVISQAKTKIMEKAVAQGAELSEDELTQMTMEEVQDKLDSYTSIAEKWGNRMVTASQVDFNLKEKSEEAFRDLTIVAHEYFHIYEDNSKTGFNIEVANPKNTWYLTTPDKKYISDPSGRAKGAYAAGTVQVMELSEIIEDITDLTKEEIDHLRSSPQDFGLINVRESNLGNPNTPSGIDSIQYDTYDPLVMQSRMMIESEMKGNPDSMKDFLGLSSNVSAFGYKYVVVKAYWISKKKIAKVVYIDELQNEQTIIVDEYYKSGTIPTEISIEWGWINQWMQGTKVGPDVYHVKRFDLLDYCPIIGMVHEIKNTEAKSLLDMMKPFQVLYNICMNQLYELLKKEIGNVASVNIRRIPKLKDGDDQDALEMWEMEAREKGIVFDDDSPENTKAPVSNTTMAKNIDLTRTQEIQARYNLAVQLKNECWELVGMSKQRLGSVSASESATGTNTAVQQSYTQTESLFVAHEYIIGQLYQAIIDASLYIESNKEVSTLSFITSEGESAFVRVNGSDLKFRDLKIFPTNRPEDTKMFEQIQGLAQAVIQNGGSIYDIVEMYSTKSLREMKKTFKDLRDRTVAMQEQAQEMEQQKMQQMQKLETAKLEQAERQHQMDLINENYQKELDRINKKEIAIIQAMGFGNVQGEDNNKNNVPDVFEVSKLASEESRANKDYNIKMTEIKARSAEAFRKIELEKEKLKVARENMINDLQVAKENAKGRQSKAKK